MTIDISRYFDEYGTIVTIDSNIDRYIQISIDYSDYSNSNWSCWGCSCQLKWWVPYHPPLRWTAVIPSYQYSKKGIYTHLGPFMACLTLGGVGYILHLCTVPGCNPSSWKVKWCFHLIAAHGVGSTQSHGVLVDVAQPNSGSFSESECPTGNMNRTHS